MPTETYHTTDNQEISAIFLRQKIILKELLLAGLILPPQIILATSLEYAQRAHEMMIGVLQSNHTEIDWDESPIYQTWNHNNDITFVSRNVTPNAKRQDELASDGKTVKQHIQKWTSHNGNSLDDCSFHMKAGVASHGSSAKYTPMQLLAFAMMVQEAVAQKQHLLIASTVRTTPQHNRPSSSMLLQNLTDKYIQPHGNQSVLAEMQRSTPTELWALFVENQELLPLRSALIHAFNRKSSEQTTPI